MSNAWSRLADGLDPLVAGTRLIGTLAADHPGSNGKDLTDIGRLRGKPERDPLLPPGFAPDDAGDSVWPHVDEGILAPIAPRRAGSMQPENDELDDGFDEMTPKNEDAVDDHGIALQVKDLDDQVVFNLIDKKTKKRLGFLSIQEDSEAGEGYWQVEYTDFELDPKKPMSGKGLGPIVYQKANDWLKKHKGARLASDTERSVPAEKMWQKLASAGKARKIAEPRKSWGGEPFDYYVMEHRRLLDEYVMETLQALFEDSRGNMVRLLKAPKEAAVLFDEKFGKNAFAVMNYLMTSFGHYHKSARGNKFAFWDPDNMSMGTSQPLGGISSNISDFMHPEGVGKQFLTFLEKKPQKMQAFKDPNATWEEMNAAIADAGKSDPKAAIERAKKEGLVLSSGWFWLPLTTDECSIEAGEMGHCGEDERGQLWSLRDPQNRAHVTLTFQENGDARDDGYDDSMTVHQVKGKQNAAPKPQYWSYIEEFFRKMKVMSLQDDELDETAPLLVDRLKNIIDGNKPKKHVPTVDDQYGFEVNDSIVRFEGALSECFMVEQDMPSAVNSYQMKFAMSKENGEDCATVTLIDRSGAKAGEVRAFDDDTTGGFKIVNAHVRDQRKGIGLAVYRKFNEWLKSKTGKHLTSDLIRSDEADGLWTKMVSSGLAKKRTAKLRGQFAGALGTREFFVMESVLHEDAKDDLALRLKFREKQEDDQKVLNVTIWSDYEETGVGFVRTFIDEKSKLVRILSAHLHPGYEKKGIGLWAYDKIDEYVKKHFGMRLASDTERSAAANGLWSKLVALGKAKHVENHFSQGYFVFT